MNSPQAVQPEQQLLRLPLLTHTQHLHFPQLWFVHALDSEKGAPAQTQCRGKRLSRAPHGQLLPLLRKRTELPQTEGYSEILLLI